MAQDALNKLNSETLDTRGVLGDQAFDMLEEALGKEKMAQLTKVVDPIVANRRAITVASAVLDVAIILGVIKFAQGLFFGDGSSE